MSGQPKGSGTGQFALYSVIYEFILFEMIVTGLQSIAQRRFDFPDRINGPGTIRFGSDYHVIAPETLGSLPDLQDPHVTFTGGASPRPQAFLRG